MKDVYEEQLSFQGKNSEEVIAEFIKQIGGITKDNNSFILNEELWFVDRHPFQHSNDIIVEEKNAMVHDKFLLVKTGSDRVIIYGWCDKKSLTTLPPKDIYRNNTKCYMVMSDNLQDLTNFKILKQGLKLKDEFIINIQEAENSGHTEMITGILAGLHAFAKKGELYFKDIDQKEIGILGDKKFKIFTRDFFSDEDMLIPETFFLNHPEIDIYILCKIKGGKYNYLGYVDKVEVERTHIVQMTGSTEMDQTGERVKRIFSDQYKNLNDIIKIYEEEHKEELIIIPQGYVPLHVHSEWSVGDGFGSVKYLAEACKKQGFKACAITEHGTMAGVWEFQKACLLQDIKPIIGCEFYCSVPEEEKSFHITVLVKDKKGWENILKLQSIGTREGFYYHPTIPLNKLLEFSEGLVVLSGCMSGIFYRWLSNNKIQETQDLLNKLKNKFKEDFYIEIMPHSIEDYQSNMKILYDLSINLKIKCVLTTDSHYPYKQDIKYHKAIKAINLKKKYEEAGFDDTCFYLMQDKDIEDKIKDCALWMKEIYKDFMKNTFEVSDKCNFKISPVEEQDTLPKLKFEGISLDEKLKQLVLEGLSKYTKYDIQNKKIKDRLDLELERIISKQYANYFLIVAEMIKWAKQKGIACGTGRGSVGACLAALCLNITDCDPIELDLLFDRFISAIRKDAPDIDMDFQDNRREEVFNYLIDTYGRDHCAKVATYARFHPKGVIRDVGRIFNIPIWEVNKICAMCIERSGGDARASASVEDTFAEFADAKEFQKKYPLAVEVAIKLEGTIRHKSSHAAAMVVSERDISSYAPINKIGGIFCLEWEKALVEEIGLIKFDILGLKTLTMIQDACKSANITLPNTFEDKKVYEHIFKPANTAGIFQFNTVGMTKYISDLDISNFSEIIDATTIYRPAALHTGSAMIYKNRKLGKEKVEYLHPELESITSQTRGTILFQEQVMQVMHSIGGFSWSTAEQARKIITKSKGKDAFNKMRAEFVRNANSLHGMKTEEAEKLYDIVCMFGSYSYNKAHAAEYSMISYYCAWLKTYYPKYFYKSLLKYEADDAEVKNIIQDMKRNNFKIEYPDINLSNFSYEIFDDKIYAGLNSISGIGLKMAEKIIKGRPYKNLEDFKKRAKISKKIFKGLIVAEAFRMFNINKREEITGEKDRDYDDIELSQLIYQHTSLIPNIDIKQSYDFGNYDFKTIEELAKLPGNQQYFLRGIVTDVLNKDKLLRVGDSKHPHHFERHLIYLNINDGTGNIACQLQPETYELFGKLVEVVKKQPVVVYGTTTKDGKKIYCDLIQIVSKEFATDAVDKAFNKVEQCGNGEAIITSARPGVSKAGNPYYKIGLHNGIQGLCFKFKEKLFPGLMVQYFIKQEPFINLKVLKDDSD